MPDRADVMSIISHWYLSRSTLVQGSHVPHTWDQTTTLVRVSFGGPPPPLANDVHHSQKGKGKKGEKKGSYDYDTHHTNRGLGDLIITCLCRIAFPVALTIVVKRRPDSLGTVV